LLEHRRCLLLSHLRFSSPAPFCSAALQSVWAYTGDKDRGLASGLTRHFPYMRRAHSQQLSLGIEAQ